MLYNMNLWSVSTCVKYLYIVNKTSLLLTVRLDDLNYATYLKAVYNINLVSRKV